MSKKVESIKHKTDTRAHIPSKEEAGYEDAILNSLLGKVSEDYMPNIPQRRKKKKKHEHGHGLGL